MITYKIKALLSLKNCGITKFAAFLGKSQPSLSNKAKRDTWNVSDLISLAELTNTKLCFIDKDTNEILVSLDKEDISSLK